jgi:uncharacterized protein YdeI (YjbR/CyaY-like superfamily)
MKHQHDEQIYLPDSRSWRAWLEANHNKLDGVWLIYYKKHTGKSRVPYNEAVEEALCYGWIDSTVKRIDEDRYMQKFTPRKAYSSWSDSNKERVGRLIREGKMTDAGLRSIELAKKNGKWDEVVSAKRQLEFDPQIMEMLKASRKAFAAFQKLAPSHERNYRTWVMSAKRPETRLKRCREMIVMLEKNQKLGMK